MDPDRGKQSPILRGDTLSYTGLLYSAKWFFIYTGLSPWMIQVCIHKNYNRSWTKDCNLRCLQGHMNEWKGTGSWMYSIDISVLVYSKCSFLYTDCGDNIKGHVQMSFKPPSPWSFTCLESGTWFPSFLATRNRHMTECWPVGHRQGSWRGLPFFHFHSFCLKYANAFQSWTWKPHKRW